MVIYKLAQKVNTGIDSTEWIDIAVNGSPTQIISYADKILKFNPDSILSLRKVEETEMTIGDLNAYR